MGKRKHPDKQTNWNETEVERNSGVLFRPPLECPPFERKKQREGDEGQRRAEDSRPEDVMQCRFQSPADLQHQRPHQ